MKALIVAAALATSRCVATAPPPLPPLPRFISRAGQYFGLRTQEASPILTGLAWIGAHDVHRGSLRHGAWQHHKLQQWGWLAHDAHKYGREFLGDAHNNVNISIEYVDTTPEEAKRECRSWSARVSGEAADPRSNVDSYISIFSYVAMDGATLEAHNIGASSTVGTSVLVSLSPDSGGAQQRSWSALLIEEAPSNVHHSRARTFQSAAVLSDFADTPTSPELGSPHWLGVSLPTGAGWRVDDVLEEALRRSWDAAAAAQEAAVQAHRASPGVNARRAFSQPLVAMLNDTIAAGASLLLVQHVVSTAHPFELEWSFLDAGCKPSAARLGLDDVPKPSTLPEWSAAVERAGVGMRHGAVAAAAEEGRAAFEKNLCRSLGLCQESMEHARLHVASHAMGNLLGSITYFHGPQLIATPGWYETTEPLPLYTGVPSRSFFPRGFLWDEGFHQLVASQFNSELSQRVLSSWFDTMTEEGYIAREVILGQEAQSRVHSDFWVQFRDHANPPTFFITALVLAVDGLCGDSAGEQAALLRADGSTWQGGEEGGAHLPTPPVRRFCARHVVGVHQDDTQEGLRRCTHACRGEGYHSGSDDAANASQTLRFVSSLYWQLGTHLEWFQATQAGPEPLTFRWRGSRKGGDKLVWHHFTSGLDDYPRGLAGHELDEHVDLLAWMAQSALVLAELAVLVDDRAGEATYRSLAQQWGARLDRYWDDTLGAFCDRGISGYEEEAAGGSGGGGAAGMEAAGRRPVIGPVCHLGYVAMMPLLFRLLEPRDPRIGRMLDWMTAPEHTWSKFGLRALSQSDPLYGVEESFEEDYWRSSVWVNINYLAVAALRYYATVDPEGPHALRAGAVATELESRVIEAVVDEYWRTGFLWEHYNSTTGGRYPV